MRAGLTLAGIVVLLGTGRFENSRKGFPSWAHPVISGGRLYVRNQDILKVYDIKSQATP